MKSGSHDEAPAEQCRQPRLCYKLTDLMAEMPDGLPRVDGWDEIPAVGLEQD